jgi:type 1 glutamine amidotransferase
LIICAEAQKKSRVLIFTRTVVSNEGGTQFGFREKNIEETRPLLMNRWKTAGYSVDTSENAGLFTPTMLDSFQVIVFLKTSGNIFNTSQQNAFEAWLRKGGAFLGIHSALDTEKRAMPNAWAFYDSVVCGAFVTTLQYENTKFAVKIVDTAHAATRGLPLVWNRTDEVYDFLVNPRPRVKVLAEADETSYSGGKMNGDHPISWTRTMDKGRIFITAMGHTTASYSEANFLKHLDGALTWTLTGDPVSLGEIKAFRPGKQGQTWRRPWVGLEANRERNLLGRHEPLTPPRRLSE